MRQTAFSVSVAALVALLLVTCSRGSGVAAEPGGAPAPEGTPRGIDVSHYSGSVDWRQVAGAGYSFAYVKATEGVDDADPAFRDHWQRLAEAGLLRGAYHFYVTEDDPEEQARFFLDTVEHRTGDLVPVVDIEILGRGTPAGLADRLRRFLDIIEQEIGARPMVYTEPNFWDAHLTPDFGHHPLWVAEYGTDEPRIPKGWSRWTLWQWVEEAEVPGVEKGADLSRLHPDVELSHLQLTVSD